MKKSRTVTSLIAILLTFSLIAPSAFFAIPRTAHAQAVPTGEVPFSLLTLKEILIEVNTFLTQLAEKAQWVNTYILQPIAFIKSGQLMKSLTAGVVAFVTGTANGTGVPQFVQNLQGNLQQVGDAQAIAFLAQFGRNSNSPFASAITSSLRTNYLQNTSAAGFWAANRSTLGRYSPNINAYLGGNWSQGGLGAWFALTTQNQNNPYTLYQASQGQLASLVGNAQAVRSQTLAWGDGFLSWCGPVPDDVDTESQDIAPSDPCTQNNGKPGVIKTPGSVISSSLTKALGGAQDKLVQMGAISTQLSGILGNIATIMGTINLAKDVLQGPSYSGLAGAGNSPAFRGTSFDTAGAIAGVYESTGSSEYAQAGNAAFSDRIAQYETAWNTVKNAALSASTTVSELATFCTTAANEPGARSNFAAKARAQAADAQLALTSTIAPALAQAATAEGVIKAARVAMERVQALSGKPEYTAAQADLQKLPPSQTDVTNIQRDAQSSGASVATPEGSLNVSGGALIDRLNLLKTNAPALRPFCTPSTADDPPPPDTSSGG